MAQPQGLNVPSILTTGIVGTILTMVVVEGVRAYYNHYLYVEEVRKWGMVEADDRSMLSTLRKEQENHLKTSTLPIDVAMKKVVETGGRMPATQPAK